MIRIKKTKIFLAAKEVLGRAVLTTVSAPAAVTSRACCGARICRVTSRRITRPLSSPHHTHHVLSINATAMLFITGLQTNQYELVYSLAPRVSQFITCAKCYIT